ncbi:MAG: cysteine hydrolase, partial [Betaproteobacteria bacterium]
MKRIRLLVIDPQNDFMDVEGAALPVPGAAADMARLAGFIDAVAPHIAEIVLTLDSHASVGIERTSFWLDASGAPVAPFTSITAQQLAVGAYRPRHMRHVDEALAYLKALEAGGERMLVVWPVHCVLGTWGHNIAPVLAQRIAAWEMASGQTCDKVLKGLNPMTEQYSAFRADVPRADDPRTQRNLALLSRLASGDDLLVVAGEALSHCVAASGEDMLAGMDAARLRNTVFLSDCMSPVAGFEAAASAFVQQLRDHGVQVRTT